MEQDTTKEGDTAKALGKVIQIDGRVISDHLGWMVRDTVEETLNAMLDAEADAGPVAMNVAKADALRALQAKAAYPERRSDAEGPQTAGPGP